MQPTSIMLFPVADSYGTSIKRICYVMLVFRQFIDYVYCYVYWYNYIKALRMAGGYRCCYLFIAKRRVTM